MELQDKLLPLLKEHAMALGLGVVGLICLGYGLLAATSSQSTDTLNNIPSGQVNGAVVKSFITPPAKEISIDIEGSVEKPGVYKLPANSRIQDALIAAGGLSEAADRQKVAQTVNMAAPLTDSAKLYIPAVGEQYMGSSGVSNGTSGNGIGSGGLVNINEATEAELDALPGVGAVTVQKIIDNRPYQNVQELLDKKVVGQSEFTKIKDQISVY